MPTAIQTEYSFGPFRYDAEQHLLFRNGEIVPLEPKAADTLAALLERQGRIVDKADLKRLVWPDTTVEEIGLARNISMLRKALGEDADAPRYIETIPRRGYRFIAEPPDPAQFQTSGESLTIETRRSYRRWFAGTVIAAVLLAVTIYWQFYRPSRFVAGRAGDANIAVVPFECLSPEIGCGAFSKSFEELLTAEVSKFPGTQQISPGTVQRYQRARISMPWMARMLGIEVLLEGTVQKFGDRLRITARLSDVHSGRLIWAESFDYPAADVGAAQAEAARAIAVQVGAKLKKS